MHNGYLRDKIILYKIVVKRAQAFIELRVLLELLTVNASLATIVSSEIFRITFSYFHKLEILPPSLNLSPFRSSVFLSIQFQCHPAP